MKLLVIGNSHHKNKRGLEMILNSLKIQYSYSNNCINGFDIVYSPFSPVNCSTPTIYGPHFSVFPENKINKVKKGIYIQPSEWVIKYVWDSVKHVPIVPFPFPVETEKFKEIKPFKERSKILVYFKRRNPREFQLLSEFLNKRNINFVLFKYGKYKEANYLDSLQNAKYMIVLDAHESQGFAIEEAMSCNVPLLVWNAKSMNQETGQNYPDIKATSIPYWDERCGEFFYEKEHLESTFDKFISKLETYKPRDYIVENLGVEKCSERFLELIEKAKENN